MATNVKASFIIPELLADAIGTTFASGVNAIVDLPGAIKNPSLPTEARGGDVVKVPYLGNIGEFEDVAEDVALTPVAVTSSSETGTVARAGKAISITKWAEIAAAYEDPYVELAKQLVEGAARRMDSALITAASAAYAGGTPGNTAGLVYDISATGNGLISWDAVTDTKMKWGDEQDEFAGMVCHSKIWGDLQKIKNANGDPLAVEKIMEDGRVLRMFNGLKVKVSDKLAPASSVYSTLLIKQGALLGWFNPTPSVEVDKDILKDSRLAAVNMYFVAYRYKHMAGKRLPGVAVLKTK